MSFVWVLIVGEGFEFQLTKLRLPHSTVGVSKCMRLESRLADRGPKRRSDPRGINMPYEMFKTARNVLLNSHTIFVVDTRLGRVPFAMKRER